MPPHVQPVTAPGTPERRSAADLQKILDSLIGDTGVILTRDLPDVISEYEIRHDLMILDHAESEGLRAMCAMHSDLQLGPSDLFTFLTMIPKAQPTRPSSPSLSHSQSLPPTAFKSLDTTPTQPRTRRRVSDRIRSPSDTSSSEDETNPNRPERQTPAPPTAYAFPASTTAQTGLNRPIPPKRMKTLSNSSRLDSPLAVRIRGGLPPSAYSNDGGFARPSPASRRRRGSAGSNGGFNALSPEEDAKSPEMLPTLSGRSMSNSSLARDARSPTWDSGPLSPGSPTGIDDTSFYARAKSPETDGDVGVVDEIMGSDGEEGEEDDDVDQAEALVRGSILLNPRLSRISTDSINSLRTSHDKLRALQKQNTELTRKLKDSDRQLALLGAENDRIVADLQDKLEEARGEINQRRKDEKDMKGKERALTIQISSLEADLQNQMRLVEVSKTNNGNLQRMYNSQCDEAGRLRDLLRDRDAEIGQLEEIARGHEADEEKFDREIKALESESKRLESDLTLARQAESILETQKQENLQLKETIDRMRFDLDEARAAVASGAGGHGRGGTGGSSAVGTLSRNLGDEISRRLLAKEIREEREDKEGEDEGEDEGDSFVETIVTTQRTRKVGGRKGEVLATGNTNIPAIRIEEGIKEYADAATNTEIPLSPVPEAEAGPSMMADNPPAYTPKSGTRSAQEVLDHAHPRDRNVRGGAVDVEEEYEGLVDGLGLRCSVMEEEIRSRKEERVKLGLEPRSTSRSRSRPRSGDSQGVRGYIRSGSAAMQHHMGVTGVCVGIFAVGLVAGAQLFGASTLGMHPRDLQMFTRMNTLAMARGAGEGILPVGHGVLSVAGMVAGRVPT